MFKKPPLILLHSSHDRRLAWKLYRHLSALGVFVSPPDAYEICRRHPFEHLYNYAKESTRELVCVILSPNSVKTKWCQLTLRQALREERSSGTGIILPLLFRRTTPPSFLTAHQYHNFSPFYYKTLAQMVALLNNVKIPSLTCEHETFIPHNVDQVNQIFEQAGWEVIPACSWLDILKFHEELDKRGMHISLPPDINKSDLGTKMVPKEYLAVHSSFPS